MSTNTVRMETTEGGAPHPSAEHLKEIRTWSETAAPRGRQKNAVLEGVLALQQAAPGLSLSEILTFLHVAENEGARIKDVAQLCGFTEATASRSARGLAPPDMPGALSPAHGLLVLVRGPRENTSRHVYLTDRGRALRDRINEIIAAASPIASTSDRPRD